MGRNIGACSTAVLRLLGMGYTATAAPGKPVAPPSAKEIAQWIQQLDDESFSMRDSASKKLLKGGKMAVEPLAVAARGKSLEVTYRSIRILDELAASEDDATANAARKALTEIA